MYLISEQKKQYYQYHYRNNGWK